MNDEADTPYTLGDWSRGTPVEQKFQDSPQVHPDWMLKCTCSACTADKQQVEANRKYIESLKDYATTAGEIIPLPGAIEYRKAPPMFTLTEHENFNGYSYTYTFSAPTMTELFEMRRKHQTERKLEREAKNAKTDGR